VLGSVESYDELTSAAVDPYIAMRIAYLSYRAAQLKK
jgi:ABC-type transporter lipoprotein component MlaA